ncbi:hypothetical protein FM107_05440 [Sphingobacterium sp. JB170]|nr:hypothetical protein FM107_05440 [Sphingobacterium sp. JB170]
MHLTVNLLVQNSNSLLEDLRGLNQLKDNIIQSKIDTLKNEEAIKDQRPPQKKSGK